MQGLLTEIFIYRLYCNKLLTEESPVSSLVIKIMEKYALFLILILIHFEEFLNLYTFAKKDKITINHSGRLVLLSDAKAC